MNYNELSGKSVLVLGKTRALNAEEFDTLLKLHKISRVSTYNDDVALIVEGRMMNPYEQEELAHLYETQHIPIEELSGIEEWLCRSIEPNRLLMSLKLSRNQERLVDFLQNPYITDELYFKLLKLYDWKNEGLFDNDTNRNVTASIIGRFYIDLDRNHNVQYAMSGLTHLIERYGNEELINAVAELPPIVRELKNPSDRSLSGILDVIALHSDTPENLLYLLLEKRARLLAHREPLALERELLALKDDEINTILSKNPTLSKEGAELLENFYPHLIAMHIILTDELFERFMEKNSRYLAANLTLNTIMQQRLYDLEDETIFETLASNPIIERGIVDRLFEAGKYSVQLAKNSALSPEKVQMLYSLGDSNVLSALAANPSTPIEILYQLSLDQRFERSVKTNPTFGKHIQTYNIGWS